MRVEATAPAKLILSGEYAVLDGAPAVVMAVDRRVRVVVERAERWSLISDLVPGPIALTVDEDGRLLLPRGTLAIDDPMTRALAEVATRLNPPPLEVRIESAALCVAPGGAKLGLGSSAAVIVALLAAVEALTGIRPGAAPAPLDEALRLHRAIQDGRGSGVDVAASRTGGLLCFERPNRVRPLAWPEALPWAVLWTGQAASTTAFLERLEQARAADPRAVEAALTELSRRAEHCATCFEQGNIAPVLEAVNTYRRGLERLGETIDAPILSPPHRRMVEVAGASGAVYKPSGAGGGDVGVLLARTGRELDVALRAAEASGFLAIPVRLDPDGVRVRTTGQD